MLNIYKTIVRPHLEYCAQLWSPPAQHGNWSMIIALENVQRRFTRLINDIGTLPYSERLRALCLTTLAERRIRGDLIETFKILNGLVSYGKNIFNIGRNKVNLISRPSKSSDRHVRKIVDSFISERVVKYWNKLPLLVKKSSSVHDFKINLNQFKMDNISFETNNFWEVSDEVISKIEGDNYLINKAKQISYLKDNPFVAKRKGINMYGA